MSATEIYRLGDNPGQIASVRTSWDGAMNVWNYMAKTYFGLNQFPMFDPVMRGKIWESYKFHVLPEHEIIVLLSTMDNAIVSGENIGDLINAFRKYRKGHFEQQADIIEQSNIEKNEFIAWNQTTVNSFWGRTYTDDDDEEYYDPTSGTTHFDVFEDLKRIKEKYGKNG